MDKDITFFAVSDNGAVNSSVQGISEGCGPVKHIYNVGINEINTSGRDKKDMQSGSTVLFCCNTKPYPLNLGYKAIERMADYLTPEYAGMAYADHYIMKEGVCAPHPVIDYQEGSVRRRFCFGSLIMFRTDILRRAAESLKAQKSIITQDFTL